MDLAVQNLSFQKVNQIGNNFKNSALVNFTGKEDSFELSQESREKRRIASNLAELGFKKEEAREFTDKYYGSEEYSVLVNGEMIDEGSEEEPEYVNTPQHALDLERNLTPEEAVVYLALDMEHSREFADKYDYGDDFLTSPFNKSPLDYAKIMKKENLDFIDAALVLNNEVSLEDLKSTDKYFPDREKNDYDTRKDVTLAILKNKEVIDKLTSDETDDTGSFKSGLIRPLTIDEAVILTTFVDADKLTIENINSAIQETAETSDFIAESKVFKV